MIHLSRWTNTNRKRIVSNALRRSVLNVYLFYLFWFLLARHLHILLFTFFAIRSARFWLQTQIFFLLRHFFLPEGMAKEKNAPRWDQIIAVWKSEKKTFARKSGERSIFSLSFFLFGRLIKRYSKRFDTIMFSFCVGFSIFLFGLRLFVLLFFSFCHFLHSRKIHGFILTGYQMLAVFGVPNCCRCVRPLELSFSACIILTPNQIFHGCWFFYLLVLSLFSSRFAFSIQCLLSQWSEIDVRKKTECGRI